MASTSYVVFDDDDDDDDDYDDADDAEEEEEDFTKRGSLGCEGGTPVKPGTNPNLELHTKVPAPLSPWRTPAFAIYLILALSGPFLNDCVPTVWSTWDQTRQNRSLKGTRVRLGE